MDLRSGKSSRLDQKPNNAAKEYRTATAEPRQAFEVNLRSAPKFSTLLEACTVALDESDDSDVESLNHSPHLEPRGENDGQKTSLTRAYAPDPANLVSTSPVTASAHNSAHNSAHHNSWQPPDQRHTRISTLIRHLEAQPTGDKVAPSVILAPKPGNNQVTAHKRRIDESSRGSQSCVTAPRKRSPPSRETPEKYPVTGDRKMSHSKSATGKVRHQDPRPSAMFGTFQPSQMVPSQGSIPFTLQYPKKPPKTGSDWEKNVFYGRDDGAIPELAMKYAVLPGTEWGQMKSCVEYKVPGQTFTRGGFVYVCNKQLLERPADDAPDSEKLKFDRENFFLGRICDFRAEKNSEPEFCIISWAYWPEELPMGRQGYHGRREVVISNAMDIIHVRSIERAADVSYWNEADDDGDSKLQEIFWRQTLNFNKSVKGRYAGLSKAMKHCKCQKEYNPDKTMFRCLNENCGTWNHEECLLDDVCTKTCDLLFGSQGVPGQGMTKGGVSKTLDKLIIRPKARGDLGMTGTVSCNRPWDILVSVESEPLDGNSGKVVARIEAVKRTRTRNEEHQLTGDLCCLKCGDLLH